LTKAEIRTNYPALDSTPLLETLRQLVDDDAVAAVAAEYLKGRRLFIGTTEEPL